MLKVVVVDCTAESRNKIIDEVVRAAALDESSHYLPRISVKPLSLDEVPFHGAPDICILGEQVLRQDLPQVGKIRKLFPAAALVIRVGRELQSFSIVEQLARMGVDDVLPDELSGEELVRKLIILSRRSAKPRKGKLILVEGATGGSGTTSVVAGLAEELLDAGKKVAVFDFDFERQSLSRFLQTRPFLNESFEALLAGQRPVTEDFVRQCLVRVWEGDEFYCVPPPPESSPLFVGNPSFVRTLVSILELLDEAFDCLIVDAGRLFGSALETLYRVADYVLTLSSHDPGSLYASVSTIKKTQGLLSSGGKLHVLETRLGRSGLPSAFLRNEICRAAGVSEEMWIDTPLCWSAAAFKWPGSGATITSLGGNKVQRPLRNYLAEIDLIEKEDEKSISKVRELIEHWKTRCASERAPSLQQKVQPMLPACAAIPAPAVTLHLPNNFVSVSALPDLKASAEDLPAALISGARIR